MTPLRKLLRPRPEALVSIAAILSWLSDNRRALVQHLRRLLLDEGIGLCEGPLPFSDLHQRRRDHRIPELDEIGVERPDEDLRPAQVVADDVPVRIAHEWIDLKGLVVRRDHAVLV